MFEASELGHNLDKATFDRELPRLREELLVTQYELLKRADFPVLLVVAGFDGAGRGETVNALTEWMDPRQIEVHAMSKATEEECERPFMWRFWRRMPPSGKIGIFFSSWYGAMIQKRALGKTSDLEFQEQLSEIRRFEKMLADEGALILKFWFHLSKKAQRQRLNDLWCDKRSRYRVTKHELKQLKLYDQYRSASERALGETDAPEAPWLVIEGVDARYRHFNTGQALLDAMKKRLTQPSLPTEQRVVVPNVERVPLVRTMDLSLRLEKDEYERKMEKQQRRLALLCRRKAFSRVSPVLVFEGMDAAGKGGAIRRITKALDARIYDIRPTAAPTDEEKRQPYLWRFWRYAPRDGKFAIFDRSWYGRVLVERIEGFADEWSWMRAYGEINDFEAQLVRADNIVVKFWLQLSQDEQLRRFKERESVAFKRFKITEEDWRNREKWPVYERAASDMIERTNTTYAPWTLIEAEDKYYARVKILRTVCDAIENAM